MYNYIHTYIHTFILTYIHKYIQESLSGGTPERDGTTRSEHADDRGRGDDSVMHDDNAGMHGGDDSMIKDGGMHDDSFDGHAYRGRDSLQGDDDFGAGNISM